MLVGRIDVINKALFEEIWIPSNNALFSKATEKFD